MVEFGRVNGYKSVTEVAKLRKAGIFFAKKVQLFFQNGHSKPGNKCDQVLL